MYKMFCSQFSTDSMNYNFCENYFLQNYPNHTKFTFRENYLETSIYLKVRNFRETNVGPLHHYVPGKDIT